MKNIYLAITLLICLIIPLSPQSLFSETIENIINSNSAVSIIDNDDRDAPVLSSAESHTTPEAAYALQVGLFQEQDQADKQIVELKSKGFEPYIFQSLNSMNKTVYSVRIGQFQTFQAASAEKDRLSDILSTPILVTAYNSIKPAEKDIEPGAGRIDGIVQAQAPENPGSEITAKGQDSDKSESSSVASGTMEERLKTLEAKILELQEQAETRKKLQITEQEAKEDEEDILEAAGREYTLTSAGNIKFSYGFSYTYSEYDAIRESVRVEDVANHTLSNSFNLSYGVKDNLTVSTGIPFVYKYHRVGTIAEQDITDLGDLSLNWQFQPFKTTSDMPTIIINGGFDVPVGRSPYEIQVGEELSTSSGFYSTSLGVSVSQSSDPVVVFGSLSGNYSLPLDDINQKRPNGILEEIDPGFGIGTSVGMAYAMSYKLNLNLSISYSYNFETEYKFKNAPSAKSGTSASASLRLGSGYRLSRKQNLNFSFGIPITNTGTFSFSFSTPIEFEL